MSSLERFTISLERRLLEEFDQRNAACGYASRSEAIRDLIRDRLVADQWLGGDPHRPAAATVTLIYDHHGGDVGQGLTALQHDHEGLVVSTLHVHLDHDHCLETIVLRGPAGDVAGLAEKLIALKGVKHGKAVYTAEGEGLR